ncbi:sigma-54-dependent transcriptional regulator [Labilithrix luteola]|uniref:sigma-54-dependent transcriptional regulator n=1 Tax=Labilithrix luteola TaxID=1391654 RepID=UPI000AEB402D|nr:sigma-54 dependent transcriptional regulator [Labilithrix luteola]
MMVERLAKTRTRSASQRHSVPLDILVVDDDEASRLSLSYALTDAGHKVTEALDGEEAIALISERIFDVAILDVRLPKVDGLTIFRRIRQKSPSTSVILMTAFASVPDAVASLREGAYDYVTKPFDAEEFSLRVIGHIAEHRALRNELEEARKLVASRDAGSPIIGNTPSMVQLVERINTVAQSDAPVLIRGESGTGKKLVAHTLHARSPRKNGPFVAVNCAAFPENMIEAELFGHERGAFVGALRDREGRFKAADGGSLLLDEIAALPLPAQAKLLRVLEEGVIKPLGTNTSVPINVRVLAATDQDLKELVSQGKFREDLYFRVNVVDLTIPPLRERRADLPLLLAHFLRRFYPGRVPPGIAPRAWTALMEYPFPGNVREFAHSIERAVVLAHGNEIDLEHLPADIAAAATAQATPPPPAESEGGEGGLRPLAVAAKEFEKQYLLRALKLANGAKTQAAEMLGISRKNLWEKLKQHAITDDDVETE